MRKSRLCILLFVLALGTLLFFQQFQLEGLDQLRLRRRGDQKIQAQSVLTERTGQRLRIATFNLQVFGKTKSRHLPTLQNLARICRQFDLIAVQEIVGPDQDSVPLLVEEINRIGPRYAYLASVPLGRSAYKQQFAFIYNRDLLEVDLTRCCAIEDPDDLFEYPPFVGFFQVRDSAADQPFRFTLVNCQVDAENPHQELQLLGKVHSLVEGNGRDEDDVILLGSFQADSDTLNLLLGPSGLTTALDQGQFTDTRLATQLDNMVFRRATTSELVGRAEVFRFMRRFNLSLQQALEVSDRLPVWAEF